MQKNNTREKLRFDTSISRQSNQIEAKIYTQLFHSTLNNSVTIEYFISIVQTKYRSKTFKKQNFGSNWALKTHYLEI